MGADPWIGMIHLFFDVYAEFKFDF